MKALFANGLQTLSEQTVEVRGGGLVKVKIHFILPTFLDVDIFRGRGKRYPLVPCHMATAFVSEDYPEFGLKQGAKVVLSPYIQDETSMDNKVMGVSENGFLANFVELSEAQVIPLPEDVKETEAIFADYIALAYAAVRRMDLKRGDSVTIIGGGAVTNILAQLVMYYQAVPILIHNRQDALNLAKDAGVYYTINAGEEVPLNRVKEITGGRMAEHSVIAAATDVAPNHLFSLTRDGGDCIIMAPHGNFSKLDADLSEIYRRNLRVSGISSGREDVTSAVNILAQRVLKLDCFIDKLVPIDESQKLFQGFMDNPSEYFCRMIEVLPSSLKESAQTKPQQ